MLAEFGVIPDVFDQATYSSPELGEVCLAQLLDVCREEAVVRDLCDGGWSDSVRHRVGLQRGAAKEVLETLVKEGRFRRCKQSLPHRAETDAEWYYEAIKSSQQQPLDLIVAGIPEQLGGYDPAVTAITKLSKSGWWQRRSNSVEVQRVTTDYLRVLRPLFQRAGAFMFVDPNIDERQLNYAEFSQLIRGLCGPGMMRRLEIHIAQKDTPTISEWRLRLQNCDRDLAKAKRSATVYVWPVNFHDRYLITNLTGIQLPYGFDIATRGVKETTWARLGRRERAAVELRFEPNAGRFGEVRCFSIGRDAQ